MTFAFLHGVNDSQVNFVSLTPDLIKQGTIMELSKVAELIWNNAKTIEFGCTPLWDENTFLKKWFTNQETNIYPEKDCPGWYWFQLDMPLNDIIKIGTPANFPKKGCKFGPTAKDNKKLFGTNLCHSKSDLPIIYNGHEDKVFSRVRTHFNLEDDSTGALGIKNYPLSSERWTVYIFHREMIDETSDISKEQKDFIRNLADKQIGRIAIEAQWRAMYGWPILCKS